MCIRDRDKASKLILERITPFASVCKELWIQFADMKAYLEQEAELYRLLMDSEGEDAVVIYVRRENQKKILPPAKNVKVNQELLEKLYRRFGEKNVKAVQKRIENAGKMN